MIGGLYAILHKLMRGNQCYGVPQHKPLLSASLLSLPNDINRMSRVRYPIADEIGGRAVRRWNERGGQHRPVWGEKRLVPIL